MRQASKALQVLQRFTREELTLCVSCSASLLASMGFLVWKHVGAVGLSLCILSWDAGMSWELAFESNTSRSDCLIV